jgi:hypothetical protein
MKIPIKYGLLITVGVVAWLIVAHLLVPDPASLVHSLGAGIFFNLLEIVGIGLGIKAKQAERGGTLSFKSGVKTGVAIALVYAIATSLFFLGQISLMGTEMMAHQQAPGQPMWQVLLGAFAGLIIGALLLGLVYATIISFIVVKSQKERDYS